MPKGTPKVAVIDDDVVHCMTLTSLLQQQGCESECFSDSRKALEALKKRDFDMAFVDLIMPHLSGLALAAELQRARPGHQMLLWAMTSSPNSPPEFEVVRSGFQKLLIKPLILRNINEAIMKWREWRPATTSP